MRHIVRTFVLLGALAMSASAFAAAPQATKTAPAKKASTAPAASHSIKGVVKSVDSSSLVIAKGKKDMSFVLDSSTVKEGTPAVGSDVSVRYRTEGKTMVATAVTVQPAKQVASAKPAASKKVAK
jgi:hypothetical protein